MHIVSVGVSKFCFLFSLVFCGLLLLLLPALQPPPRMMDLPQPRPQVRPAQTGAPLHAGVPLVSRPAGEAYSATWLNRSSARLTKATGIDNPKSFMYSKDGAYLGENGSGLPGSRSGDLLKLKDIFIAVKTTKKYHKSRLELLIQTWISKAKEQVRGAAFYVALFIA